MSYDVWMEHDFGNGFVRVGAVDWNYTYNISPMTHRAGLGSINDLNGLRADDAADRITKCIAAMEANPDVYRALNPENGWGDYDGFLAHLKSLRDGLQTAPEATVRVR